MMMNCRSNEKTTTQRSMVVLVMNEISIFRGIFFSVRESLYKFLHRFCFYDEFCETNVFTVTIQTLLICNSGNYGIGGSL